MSYFVCKLIPPRKSFPKDMSPAERELMGKHAEYWRGLMNKGQVIVFGPVDDPDGPYGLAVL